jgi:hypothetical protein
MRKLAPLIQLPIIDFEVIEGIFEKMARHLRRCMDKSTAAALRPL